MLDTTSTITPSHSAIVVRFEFLSYHTKVLSYSVFWLQILSIIFVYLPHVFIDGTPWKADDLLCSFRSMYGCGRHVVHTTPVVRIFLNLYFNNSS
jgi:hypothetical protein